MDGVNCDECESGVSLVYVNQQLGIGSCVLKDGLAK